MTIEAMSLRDYVSLQQKVGAEAKAARAEPWDKWPTIRDLAKRFRLSQQAMLELVEDCEHLDLCTALRIGSGVASFGRVGDYRVEWIGEDE